jgi:hypothetical protein
MAALGCDSIESGEPSAPKLLPFQGRLTDEAGNAVTNGTRVVLFQIYDAPVNGALRWPGELHRTTVNGGLINVQLGTGTPLATVDFDQPLYLQITVDINGDGQINEADPPMLPRQAILPAVFAKESADSRKLAGRDWSALLVAGNDPLTGHIRASKLEPLAITAQLIKPGTLTSNQIAPQTINADQIADSTITAAKLSAQLVLDALVPVGSIIAFGGDASQIPGGWLPCDGSAFSSNSYPRLYAAIGAAWGAGYTESGGWTKVPGTDFNVPDLRSMFLRGVQGDKGTYWTDPDTAKRTRVFPGGNEGNAVGSFQLDVYEGHDHFVVANIDGQAQQKYSFLAISGNVNSPYHLSTVDAPSPNVAHSSRSGGEETRPRNAYVNYIIKY